MQTHGTFEVISLDQREVPGTDAVKTGLPVGVMVMRKEYTGQIQGSSTTVFTAAFDIDSGAGTYVALDSFEGSLNGVTGTFSFVHSATTTGQDRTDEFFHVVPGSGTGELAGIRGSGGMRVEPDGTHRIWLDVHLDD